LKLFGHKNISIIDGGLRNWLQYEFPLTNEITNYSVKILKRFKNNHLF